MIATVLIYGGCLLALSVYSVLLLAVCTPAAYRNGWRAGYEASFTEREVSLDAYVPADAGLAQWELDLLLGDA